MDVITVYYIASSEEDLGETVRFYLQRKVDGKWNNVADFTSTKEGQDEMYTPLRVNITGNRL